MRREIRADPLLIAEEQFDVYERLSRIVLFSILSSTHIPDLLWLYRCLRVLSHIGIDNKNF